MKRLTFFIGLLFTFNSLLAQKTITESYNTNGINTIQLDLSLADSIEIKNWDNNNVKVVVEVKINDNKENGRFSLKKSERRGTLKIKSDYGDLLKKNRKSKYRNIIIKGNCDSYNYSKGNNTIVSKYVVYLPKNKKIKVNSISGNIKASMLKNSLDINVISGDIDVKNNTEDMKLVSVSGDIDITVTDADFKAKTISGMVYSDLDIDFKNKNKLFGSNVCGIVKNGKAKLNLTTVSGDVFLRKL